VEGEAAQQTHTPRLHRGRLPLSVARSSRIHSKAVEGTVGALRTLTAAGHQRRGIATLPATARVSNKAPHRATQTSPPMAHLRRSQEVEEEEEEEGRIPVALLALARLI